MFFSSSFNSKSENEIFNDLAKKDYITASTVNACSKEAMNLSDKFVDGHKFYNADYENIKILWASLFRPKTPYSDKMGINSKSKRCLYGKDSFEYLFEFTLKFLELYINERKFFRIISNDAHEGTLTVIKYMDE